MSWSPRQAAMLRALGLDGWPSHAASAAPAMAAPASTSLAPGETPMEPSGPAPVIPAVEPRTWIDLDELHASVRACQACSLCRGRRQAVPGLGHAKAHWMVVGEAPGEQEDAVGEPFVGASGQLLDAMLEAVGRTRQSAAPERQVFIANTLKCRPPGNRSPTPEELLACRPYLLGQVALIRPRLILALGRFAVQSLLGLEEPIGRLRGRVHALADGTPVVVSYHPSYLLRQPLEKARAWEDLCLATETYDSLTPTS